MKLEDAAKFTGSIPDNYDRFLGPHIFHGFADDLADRVSRLPSATLLELAAGTGIVTARLLERLPSGCRVTASDLNLPMLEVARARLGSPENVAFEIADATALPYGDASFDTVVCQFGVMFFPDKHKAYGEVRRVLSPGGHYLFNVWGSLETNPFAHIANEVVTEMFPDDPPGFYKVPFSYHDVQVIEVDVVRAGFESVKVESVEIESPIISANDFATGLVYGNPLFQEVTARGGDPQEVVAIMASALAEALGDKMPLQALLIDARVA